MKQGVPAPAQIRLAIRCELIAQRGDWRGAAESLIAAADDQKKSGDVQAAAWLLMKSAEILCAHCELERAWRLFEERVIPVFDQLSDDTQAIAGRNFSFVGIVLGRDASFLHYYQAVDQDRSDHRETLNLLAAEDASRDLKHFESLPLLWRELNRAYLGGDWSSRRRAHSRMASETLAAGWVGQAAYHSIHGGNNAAAKQLAEWIIKWRNPSFADAALKYAISSSLREHTRVASELIGYLADVIPDDQVRGVLGYLLAAVRLDDVTRHNEPPVIACWEGIRRLSFRLSASDSAQVVSAAIAHPFSSGRSFGRASILKVLRSCIPRIDGMNWVALADRCLPWAREERWDFDYEHVLNLLDAIANRDHAAKQRIADAIAPSGTAVADLRLMARLASFGRHTTADQLKTVVNRVIERIPGQVWVGYGSPPTFGLSALITSTRTAPDGRTEQVAGQGGVLELDVVAAHIDLIDPSTLLPLINQICALVRNPLNLVVNRICLCAFLNSIRTALSTQMAQQICDVLFPFAAGTVTELSPLDRREESTVSSFKISGPTSAEQRAFALQTSALLIAAHPEVAIRIDWLIETAMLDREPAVRAAACRALGELSLVNPQTAVSLTAALQDTDTTVSIAAYDAVARLSALGFLGGLRPVILAAAARGVMADLPALRYRVARLVAQLCGSGSSNIHERELHSIIEILRADSHYSVRSVLSEPGCSSSYWNEAEAAILAYDLWEQRGRPFGSPEVDWFEAERQLSSRR